MNETVRHLFDVSQAEPERPAIPAYADTESFLAGIRYAANLVDYGILRANQLLAIKALDSTDDENDPELFHTALKIVTSNNVRLGLEIGLQAAPRAVAMVERLRKEIPADARLN